MIGTILNDRYEILEKIGEDDIIQVYKARCNKLNRYNTIKILKEDCIKDSSVIEGFKNEAAQLANLSNSNIVNIYDVVYQGDIYYMVMEYVIGKTLKELVVENVRLSFERSINISVQIAKALDCAHKNNIVHGDIRPENILITESGTVKVANFSLVRGGAYSATNNSHDLSGIAPYCSPEQIEIKPIDSRSDIYSLGILMYEMVTGKVPFKDENSSEIKYKILEETAVPPIQINSSIPVSLNNIIMKCIEKHPDSRYKNASEILIELLSIQNKLDFEVLTPSSKKEYTQVMPAINIPTQERKELPLRPSTKSTSKNTSRPRAAVSKSKVNAKTKSYIVYTLVGVMVVILGLVAVMSISGILAGNKEEGKRDNTVSVPNLAEKSKEEAKKLVESSGLVYKEVIENNGEVEKGKVISTNPEKGSSVKKGDTIEVVVSSGVAKKKVPNLIGKYESEAKEIVPQNGFRIGKTNYIRDGRYVKYHVVDQDPKPGEELEEGGVITYTVNLQ